MKTIGIIGAMNEEVELYISELTNSKKTEISGITFFQGDLNKNNVIIVKSGIGKVNASICAQILINKFNVSKIISTGVAGALNPSLEIKDIIISKDSVHHDMDGVGLGFEKGQIPFTDWKFFNSCENLKNIALESSKRLGLKAKEGRVLTGDQFITDNKLGSLREEFNGDCVDMEGAAIAQVCKINNISHIIIKAISDKADHSATVNFKEFLNEASKNSFRLTKDIISKI